MSAPPRDPGEWRGTAAQRAALACGAYELLYGGAAGGGKSDYLLSCPIRWVHESRFRALLLRRSFPELERTLVARSRDLYSRHGARYNEQRHEWTFPSGAKIAFGYLERAADALRYQGAEFQFIGFDELTHFDEASYRYLTSRARSADGLPVRIRATTNPGGPGHDWVRARWAQWIGPRPDAATGERRWYAPDGSRSTQNDPEALARTFFPAKLSDNPYLGAEYRAQLLALDPVTMAQLLEGDWDACVGEGKLFHRTWWVYFDAAPPVQRKCRAWDFGAGGDATEGVLVGDRGAKDSQGNPIVPRYIVLDCITHVGPPHEVHALVKATAMADGPDVVIRIPQDPGQAGKDQAQTYTRELTGFRVVPKVVTGDKVLRAGGFSSQVGARNVGIVRAHWTPGFVGQLHAFPDAKADDKVDAGGDAFTELAMGGSFYLDRWDAAYAKATAALTPDVPKKLEPIMTDRLLVRLHSNEPAAVDATERTLAGLWPGTTILRGAGGLAVFTPEGLATICTSNLGYVRFACERQGYVKAVVAPKP